jgi:hypothetical protein
MKHSLIACALFFCGVINAQTGFVEFPYNPDSDGDDFIGITDLLSLLSLYESEFSEEGLFLASDSTEALYYTGNKTYAQCHKSCNDLPGKWWIPNYSDILLFDLNLSVIPPGGNLIAWIDSYLPSHQPLNAGQSRSVIAGVQDGMYSSPTPQDNGTIVVIDSKTINGCACFTRERPRVEYVLCQGSTAGDPNFESCIMNKTSEGWYPSGSVQISPSNNHIQAFWRWRE